MAVSTLGEKKVAVPLTSTILALNLADDTSPAERTCQRRAGFGDQRGREPDSGNSRLDKMIEATRAKEEAKEII